MQCFNFFFILFLCANGADKLSNNLILLVGTYLEPKDSFKINTSLKKWSDLEVYESLTPTSMEVVLFKHKETNQLLFEDSKGFIRSELKQAIGQTEAPTIIQDLMKSRSVRYVIDRYREEWPHQYSFVEILFEREISEIEKRPHSLLKYFQELLFHTFTIDGSRILVIKILDAMGDQYIDEHLEDNETLLFRALEFKSYESCTVLLERGANPNVRDANGETPLMLSVRYVMVASRYFKYMKALLQYGANVRLRNNFGENALELVNNRRFDIEIKRKCIHMLERAHTIQEELRQKQYLKRKRLDKIMAMK